MDGNYPQPHICLTSDQMHPVVIVVGDPKRAETVAKMCSSNKELAHNREYRSFECTDQDQKFIVISHGVGSAGAAICFEELIKIGAKLILRAGTAGSLQPAKIKKADMVILTSASRDDGVTERYVPKGYAATSDFDATHILITLAKKMGFKYHLGQTLTGDIFYASPVMTSRLEQYSKAKVDIVEMEAGTLFTIARVRGIKAAALCTIDGCPLKWEDGDYDAHGADVTKAKETMLKLAISAAAEYTKKKLWQ